MNPLISVIVPTCNREASLSRAVNSVLGQSYKNLEVIIVNDSKKEIKSTFTDTRVKIISGHKVSKEVFGFGCGGYARNIGIDNAAGRYLAFLDDDDVFYKNKIEYQLEFSRINSSSAVCANAHIGIFPLPLCFLKKDFFEFYKKFLERELNKFELSEMPERINEEMLNAHNFIITSSVFVEKNLAEDAGGFGLIATGGQIVNGKMDFEDWDFWRRISKVSDFMYIKEPLLYYKRGSLKKLRAKIKNKLDL